MTVEIIIPKMGETTTEVRILRWLKSEGDFVMKGEPLIEVETDKATLEIESYAEGVLEQILVPAGEYADAMQVVALLAGESEQVDIRRKTEKPWIARQPSASPVARRMAADLGLDLSEVKGTGKDGLITVEDIEAFQTAFSEETREQVQTRAKASASPKAKRLVQEMGLDLTRIRGTGMDGMVTVDDVRKASAASVDMPIREFSRLRRTIATRMTASKQTVPHFYLMADVSMAAVEELRTRCVQERGWKRPPTYTDIIVKACALVLLSMPQINIRYSESGYEQRESIDIGVAVGIEEGLIVPVLQNIDRLDLREVSESIKGMSQRARSGKLKESDLADKSMVVSNLGMEGVDAFVAIIDPPDPFILAVGRVHERVIAQHGEIMVKPMCTLTLSADHRVLDGVIGARFLKMVKDHLENPDEIIGV